MPDPVLYLLDGYNLLHAGDYGDARELRDSLASFVALKGARGVLVFDGAGADETHGPLEVRFAAHADTLLERLAAENRDRHHVILVSSDVAVRGTSGQEVQKLKRAVGFATAMTVGILFALVVVSVSVGKATSGPGNRGASLAIEITGNQWWWSVRYPNDDGTPNRAAAFVDDMTFLESLGRLDLSL